jgi:hypothetical protein
VIYIYVIRGGLTGTWIDGSWLSHGMDELAKELKRFFGGKVTVQVWDFGSYQQIAKGIRQLPEGSRVALIGYSGGGSRSTWIANYVYPRVVDLIVAYDPSPISAMLPLRKNVRRAICYWNRHPMMLDLGGGWISGSHEVDVENHEIKPSVQHMMVDDQSSLHAQTIEAIRTLEA